VIGVGVMGADHARRLLRVISGAMVSAVTDFDTDRARPLTAELDAAVFPSANEHIAADEDDAVVIASCDADHAIPVMSCLTHRKPVLCEKPLAPTLAECCAVVDAPVAVKQL
jgi:myo-inositol 2-dehydrogenase/D-chiro-inositol 1-dehydrogenase